MTVATNPSVVSQIGATAFGFVIGWSTYYVNRYRSGGTSIADIASLVGALGGGAVLAIFPAGGVLFGWYGIGLLGGFLAYFSVLVVLVRRSEAFGVEWFLDGRRKKLPSDEEITSAGGVPLEGRRRRLE
jgi:hypothetical protein